MGWGGGFFLFSDDGDGDDDEIVVSKFRLHILAFSAFRAST
jgi:hypothetical protein